MLFKKDELKLLWPFYLGYFLFGLSAIIMPYMVIYFQKLGFSFFQISFITVATGAGMFLFEIPTGIMADVYSRKYSVIIGYIITGISIFLIPFFTNFYVLFILMLFSGIGLSFVSGAEESWVVDNLNHYKHKELQQEFFMKSNILTAFGLLFALLSAPFITRHYPLSSLWFIFSISFFASASILLFFAVEKYTPKKVSFIEGAKTSVKNTFKGFKIIYNNKILFLLVCASIFSAGFSLGSNAEQPLLIELSLPEYALGYVYAIAVVLVMAMSFGSKLLAKFKIKNIMITLTIIRMALLLAFLFIYPPLFILGAIIFILDGSIFNLADPILQTYFHAQIESEYRATVTSTKSMIKTFMLTIVGIFGGFLLDIFPYQTVIALGALAGFFVIAAYMELP